MSTEAVVLPEHEDRNDRATACGCPPDGPITVVVADDDETTRRLLQRYLVKAGFVVVLAHNGRQTLELISEEVSVVLLDLNMPEMDGIECLQRIRKKHGDIETIILTASSEVTDAVRAMKSGAFDYVTKPINPEELAALVERAARATQLARDNRELRHALSPPMLNPPFIGQTLGARMVLKMVDRVAPLDSTVLITGESGVGKGLVARMIHCASPRASKPFVTVNCTALPRELVEAELFGHEKGAFTGAHQKRPGRIEMAHQGTLFLDEVGDMPLDLQPKLLTFLQERTFQRIGGNRTISVDVRVITATYHDLKLLCEEKRFRNDLYFRVNVLPIQVPPLRERGDDILAMVEHFLTRIAARRGCAPFTLTREALQTLLEYSWPGNSRELENVLERATAYSESFAITPDDLPAEVRQGPRPSLDAGRDRSWLAGRTLVELERLAIEAALRWCRGNKAEAARRLGISEKTIYNKMRRLGLLTASEG